MTIHQAAAYLIRFDAPAPQPAAKPAANDDGPEIEELFPPPVPFEPEPQPPQRSEEEILAEAEAKFAETLANERETFESRLKEERERWTAQEANALTTKFLRAHESAMATLRADLTNILCPFVSREIIDQTLDDLVATVRQGLANLTTPSVSVTAPKDLLEKIDSALQAENVSIAAREGSDIDVHVSFSSTVVESHLNEWINRLSSRKAESQ